MSEPKWTPAQRAAIEDRGGAVLVSAAAGSGKTAVLTERAVRLITDPDHPVDADKLLIVTFTNAAAAELRARIGQALLRLSQQQPHNTSLRRQRMLLQRAPICTIDAFCLDLLHKHRQTPAAWRCCGLRRWPKRWKMPTATRTSVPLQTFTERAAPIRPQAIPSCMCTIFCALCRTTTAGWTNI